MKRDIDEGQDLNLCRAVTSETPVGTLVLFVMKGSPSHGDHGVLLKVGQHRSAVDWDEEDPDAQSNRDLRLAPLFWLEKKPVYVGDHLMHSNLGSITITGPMKDVNDKRAVAWVMDSQGYADTVSLSFLSWPKQKFTKYLNLYASGTAVVHGTLEEALDSSTKTLVETRVIEWEART